MKKFIQSLSARAEFAVVIATAFGYPIVISILRGTGLRPQKSYDGHHLLILATFELTVGALLVALLWLRGWRPRKIGLLPTLKDTGIGLLLLVATTIAWVVIWYMTWFISPTMLVHIRAIYAQLKGSGPPVAILLGTSLINASFEEIFVSGYIITMLKPMRGPIFAVSVSAVIRLAYHLYQGQMAVLGILPIGLIYAIWYARSGRLWPLIVAHTLQDIASLMR